MRRGYFAYGLNLDVASMSERCPGATLVGAAELSGYRFTINRVGLATVVPAARSRVLGVMWKLAPPDEGCLDAFEGVSENLYAKERLKVRIAGTTTSALIYRATESRRGSPRPGYLEQIIAAAHAHGFADDYVAELTRLRQVWARG